MAAIMRRASNIYGLASRQTPCESRRHLCQIANPNGTTRAVEKSLETQGVPSTQQAEAITSGVSNVRNDSLESKDGWEEIKELYEARHSMISSGIPSPKGIDQFKAYKAANANYIKEIHEFKAQLDKATDEMFKWCVAVVATGAVTGAVIRFTPEN
ncbi:hypothetical protein SSX86_005014 [Deinandra increscens subsp. villosa]|uniref:Uncharacterized protein n=1 Tax=Deinandra increscens subsp. villosa TaxID=3103831 RepID=A0AAP0HBG6_9ASTR